jgi:dolichol-phosphate mannosyltransferase
MKLMVVLPTYNEAVNLPRMIEALFALEIPETELSILVVDDGSPDGTGEIADDIASEFPGRVRVLHRIEKQGLGKAYLAGFSKALQNGAEAILQMDCDFSHQPQYIPIMVEMLKDKDMVLGSRFAKGGRVDEKWAWWRKLLSWFANSVYLRVILRARIRDMTGGFKLWRRDTLIGLGLDRIRSNGYVFQAEMTYVTTQLGYKVAEVPIYFPDRQTGDSKMTFSIAHEAALRVFQVWWRHRNLKETDRSTQIPNIS